MDKNLLYFDFLNIDLITEIVIYLNYNNLLKFINLVPTYDKLINYSTLFHYKDKELTGTMINGYTYLGVKEIIKDDPIMKFDNPYRLLYMMQLEGEEDLYIFSLVLKKELLTLDKELYNLITKNKTYIYKFKYDNIEIPYFLLDDDLLKSVEKNEKIYMEDVLNMYYFDNIELILVYINDKYSFRVGEAFIDFLDNIFNNRIKLSSNIHQFLNKEELDIKIFDFMNIIMQI